MDLKTAYSILELSPSASKDEAKKKYRELTKKFHPDVNKDPGAEDKFKKINEAYQVVSAGKQKVKKSNPIYGNPFFSHEQMVEPIEIEITISFKESVLGCKKDISYERTIKCGSCGGAGETSENNGCDQCGGRGVSIKRTGNSIMTQTCNKCHGVTNKKPCVICDESGGAITTTSVSVTIPAGIPNASMMRLGGMGHYAGSIMMMDQYQDAFLKVNVESEEGLEIDGADVVSNVSINLIDALIGCERKVKTINGDKDIVINPRSLNKDEVIIKNMGVAGKGSQRVIINVSYPEDVSKIIDVLKE